MSAGGQGSANDAAVTVEEASETEEVAQPEKVHSDALDILLHEAEEAVVGAKAKLDKQQGHLDEARTALKNLMAVANRARKAADKAK